MRQTLRKYGPAGISLLAAAGLAAGATALTSGAATATAGINASTLNGLHANEIVKASSVRSVASIDNFDGCSMQPIQSTKVKVPGKGYLLVWAGVGAARDTDNPDPAVLTAQVKVGSAIAATRLSTHLTDDGTEDSHIALSGMAPVAKKGTKTVRITAQECTSGTAYIVNSAIQTLYVPFGKNSLVTGRVAAPSNHN
jgi:hypothetical protein